MTSARGVHLIGLLSYRTGQRALSLLKCNKADRDEETAGHLLCFVRSAIDLRKRVDQGGLAIGQPRASHKKGVLAE
jgi:hypothetical protein